MKIFIERFYFKCGHNVSFFLFHQIMMLWKFLIITLEEDLVILTWWIILLKNLCYLDIQLMIFMLYWCFFHVFGSNASDASRKKVYSPNDSISILIVNKNKIVLLWFSVAFFLIDFWIIYSFMLLLFNLVIFLMMFFFLMVSLLFCWN